MNRVDLAGGASQSETSPGTTSSGMRGLSSAAAKQRLVEFGPNEIRRERGVSSLPALALVMDPPEEDVLQRPPRHPDEPMLGRPQWRFIVITGVLEATVTLSVFVSVLIARDLAAARNLAFSTLVFCELFRAFAARSTTRVFWEVGAFTNVRLLAVVACSALFQLGIHHIPATQTIFDTQPLSAVDGAVTLLVALIPVTAIEVGKLVARWRRRSELTGTSASPPRTTRGFHPR